MPLNFICSCVSYSMPYLYHPLIDLCTWIEQLVMLCTPNIKDRCVDCIYIGYYFSLIGDKFWNNFLLYNTVDFLGKETSLNNTVKNWQMEQLVVVKKLSAPKRGLLSSWTLPLPLTSFSSILYIPNKFFAWTVYVQGSSDSPPLCCPSRHIGSPVLLGVRIVPK